MGDRPSGGIGRGLKEARERRGLSLRQIASVTKIGIGPLEAIERDDFSRLPGGIFSRAFIRSYAIEVGLDPEATVERFIEQSSRDVTVGRATLVQGEDYLAIESERRMATTLLRLVALSIPIAIAILYFGSTGRPASRSLDRSLSIAAGATSDVPPSTPFGVVRPEVDVPPPATRTVD